MVICCSPLKLIGVMKKFKGGWKMVLKATAKWYKIRIFSHMGDIRFVQYYSAGSGCLWRLEQLDRTISNHYVKTKTIKDLKSV